jgi:Rieske Fe-S protein
LAELQKDPITRKDFLGFGILGAITGAILTIPPAAFVLGPIIDVDLRGQSDVPNEWFEVGPISEIPEEEPKFFQVNFPVEQVYGQKESQEVSDQEFVVESAIWVSWKAPILERGRQGSIGDTLDEESPRRPAFLDEWNGESLTQEQISEAMESLNVLSSSCAHLGCPVRWEEERRLFLCPCHGGLYDVNGGWYGGPPPRGLYEYTYEVREDGNIYVKHEFDIEPGIPGISTQEPYVI